MKRTTLFILFFVSTVSIASADIVEIKGRGILNGRVISQNEKEVQFEDAKGKKITVPMSDVSILQKDEASAGSGNRANAMPWKRRVETWIEISKRVLANLKKQTDKITKKGTDYMGKPLDRSAVDARSDSFAGALDEAGKAQAELAKKNRKITEETRRQQSEAASSSTDYDATKGRFGKL